jgi:hypothetical protein
MVICLQSDEFSEIRYKLNLQKYSTDLYIYPAMDILPWFATLD